jgi:hypothetical protein
MLTIAFTLALLSAAGDAGAQQPAHDAVTVLNTLPIKGRAPKTGYSRAMFGSGWGRDPETGCDMRNTILQRDLVGEYTGTRANNCTVEIGKLIDPYSGTELWLERGVTSNDIQIDHVVSLSNAWQTGAFGWTDSKRVAFANDPLNLLAVAGHLNAQKGDGDAATWQPPRRAYRCEFVARQIAVKGKYALWVTPPEADAMKRILAKCPGQPEPR